jgi:hypothetical protein
VIGDTLARQRPAGRSSRKPRYVRAVAGWLACRVRIEEGGELLHEDADARLRIDDGSILVAFMDDEGPVVLEGREREAGRFELAARSRPRSATLVQSGAGRSLAGEWLERGRTGAWRIDLDPAEGADAEGGDGL